MTDENEEKLEAAMQKVSMFQGPRARRAVERLGVADESEDFQISSLVIALVLTADERTRLRKCPSESAAAVLQEMLGGPAEIAARIRAEFQEGPDLEAVARAAFVRTDEFIELRKLMVALAEPYGEVTWRELTTL